MVAQGCAGGWEIRTPKNPVKLLVKQMSPSDWIVACMVPKGNMMHCILKEEDGNKNLKQVYFSATEIEQPSDITEVETKMTEFLGCGIKEINLKDTIAGEVLVLKAGDKEIAFTR